MGVIGYGIDSEHPQIKGLVVVEKDFTGEGLKPISDQDTIGELIGIDLRKNDPSPFANLTPILSAKIIGINTVSNQEMAASMIKAIRRLSQNHAFSVSISIGLPGSASDYSALCDEIEKQKMMFILAAGEPGQRRLIYPQSCKTDNKFAVGTVNR